MHIYIYVCVYIYTFYYIEPAVLAASGCWLYISYKYSKVFILLEGMYSDPTSMVEVPHPLIKHVQNENFQVEYSIKKFPSSKVHIWGPTHNLIKNV